ncbi:MAG: SGNH/GDSL hydrolase family protein [Tunicatimonas sp.]
MLHSAKKLLTSLGVALSAASLGFAQSGAERWEPTIRQFERQDSLNPVEPGAVLFVGSSSIAKWQNVADYFPDQRVLNRGFGGSEFSDLLHYADRVIYPYQPSKIFIYEGDNDLASGESPQQIMDEAKQLRARIRKALGNTPVVFISPKPSVARWELKDQYEALNAQLEAYASREKDTEFADVWTPALDENGRVLTSIFVADSLHLNAAGYRIWQKALAPYLE